jgi:hypothetical protein
MIPTPSYVPNSPGTNLWLELDHLADAGRAAVLLPEQIKMLLYERDVLINTKNELVRENIRLERGNERSE